MTAKQTQALLNKRYLEEIRKGLREAVADGSVEITGVDEEGESLYRLTDLGREKAESLVAKAKAELEAERS